MNKIPEIDSIAELARFWDVHDLTEFEDDLEEVVEPVFDHVEQMVLHIRLQPEQAAALHRIAESRGVKDADLLEEWVSEKLRVS